MTLPALSIADMESISAELEVLRPDICAVSRPPDAYSNEGYTEVGVHRCRVTPAGTGAQAPRGIPQGLSVDHIIAFELGVDVRQADRVTVMGMAEGEYDVEALTHPSFAFELVAACKWTDV